MQFDFKIYFSGENKPKGQVFSVIGNFWQKIYKFVLLAFMLVAFLLGSFVWRNNLSAGQWSEQKKQEYLNSQNSGVVFNENSFKDALEDSELRKQGNIDESVVAKDIFKAY